MGLFCKRLRDGGAWVGFLRRGPMRCDTMAAMDVRLKRALQSVASPVFRAAGAGMPGRWPSLALRLGLVSLLLSGCAGLLPSARQESVSPWRSYGDAERTLTRLAPYQTQRADVHREGLDPQVNPGVTVLHMGDVMQRFAPLLLSQPVDLDAGLRDCFNAGRRCSGYQVAVKKLARRRVGNFWLDSLNFRRETHSTGFQVEWVLVFVDDTLVYSLMGGQPKISEVEVERNPLGPLQGWGRRVAP